MSFRFPQPTNEDDFELFCHRFLRHLWNCPSLNLFGKRGERQHGIDIIDEGGGKPFRAAQCKFHEDHKTIPPAEIHGEVREALKYEVPLDECHLAAASNVSCTQSSHENRDEHLQWHSSLFSAPTFTWFRSKYL